MSIVHPEKLRRCRRCGHEWYAQQYGRLDTGFVISRRQADLRREQFRSCPSCGSTKAATLSPRAAKPVKPGKPAGPVKVSRKARKSAERFARTARAGTPLPPPTAGGRVA